MPECPAPVQHYLPPAKWRRRGMVAACRGCHALFVCVDKGQFDNAVWTWVALDA